MQVLRDVDHVAMPWANGGGTTYQVALSPPGSGLADFHWRISMADITADGPFSELAGIDRILVLLDGEAMRLDIDGEPRDVARGEVVHFSGEARVAAALTHGPTRDLNIMTRRGHCTASVTVMREPRAAIAVGPEETVLATPQTGTWHAGAAELHPRDFLIVEEPVEVSGRGALFVIRIVPC